MSKSLSLYDGESSQSMTLAFPASSNEMELFPELLELKESAENKDKNARNKTAENEKSKPSNVTLVKVKMEPTQEEDLIKYLTGRCSSGDYELENIVDVTDDVDEFSPETVTVDLTQETGEQQLARIAADMERHATSTSGSDDSPSPNGSSIPSKVIVTSSANDECFTSLSGRPSYCLSGSKAAQSARENRIKKKNYINGLESSFAELTKENKGLKSEVSSLKGDIGSLQTEVAYLKNVIANQSMLSALLKNTLKTPGVTFLSSEFDVDSSDAKSGASVPSGTKKRSLEEDLHLSSDDEEEDGCNKMEVAKKVYTRSGCRKMAKVDHDYATGKGGSPAGVKTRSSLSVEKCKENIDTTNNNNGGGICLHVSNKTVSLEFCSECSKKASIGRQNVACRQRRVNRNMEQVQV